MLSITARIAGRGVSRHEVRAWELRRAHRVAGALGIVAPSPDLDELNRRLVDHKLELGHKAIERRLSPRLRVSDAVAQWGETASRGRRRACTIELTSPVGAAEHVPDWYAERIGANDERPLLAACPDHYLSRTNPDGGEEVIETTGGAPLPVRMFFDAGDTTSIRSPADPTFAVQWVSVARTADGTAIGGVRHQFLDHPGGGFRVRLTVEFPVLTLPWMIAAHRWHLACEFSNWIEAASGTTGR